MYSDEKEKIMTKLYGNEHVKDVPIKYFAMVVSAVEEAIEEVEREEQDGITKLQQLR